MMNNKHKSVSVTFCLYARKSMEAEEKQALSIDSQINEMNKIAERDNLNVVCIKHESHSAKDSGQRIVFNELIKDLKEAKYNAILTWNTDRLSRNAGDLGQIVDLMDKGLLVEIRTFGQIFTNTPNDKFLLMILGSQAKLENDNKSINVQRGMRARVQDGLWPGVAPTGYLSSIIKGEECIKTIDPVLGPIVKEMFEKVANDGYTNRQLYLWLKDKNIRTSSGRYINFGTIHDILNRTFYYGEFEYPKGSGVWYKGKHKPLITKKLFDKTQEVLKLHSTHRGYKRGGKEPFTFARFIHCGSCGSGITATEKFKRLANGKSNRYVYYSCTDDKTRECKREYINEKELINQFLNLFNTIDLKFINNKEEINRIMEKYYSYIEFANGVDLRGKTSNEKERDLRKVIQILFEDGTQQDRLDIVKLLKNKVLLKDKKIYLDPSYITES